MQFIERTMNIAGESIHLSHADAFSQVGDQVYWASLWPSSVALAEHLLLGKSLEKKRVLELGCGCGLAGIAAGKRGGEVVVTDLMPEALRLAKENWSRNGLCEPHALQMDWCQPCLQQKQDLIIGADILYHPEQYPDLLRTLGRLVSADGRILIADPGRPHANEFFARALRAGYVLDTTHHEVELHDRRFGVTVTALT